MLSFDYKCCLFLAWDAWLAPKIQDVAYGSPDCQIYFPPCPTLQPISPGLSNKEPSLLSWAVAPALNVNRKCHHLPLLSPYLLSWEPQHPCLFLTPPGPQCFVFGLQPALVKSRTSLLAPPFSSVIPLLICSPCLHHVLRAHWAGVRR